MSGLLFGGISGAPALAGLRAPTSVYGLPIPIVYGRARIAPNLIYLQDQIRSQSQAGGKAATKAGQVQYNIRAAVALALCEGPIAGVIAGWQDKNGIRLWSSFTAEQWSVALGSAAQAAWSYVTTNHPTEAVPYQYLAYLYNAQLDLPGGSMPHYSFEVDGFFAVNAAGGTFDANPRDVLYDLVTDANHGLGLSPSLLGALANYQTFCTAAGLLVSPAYTTQRAGIEHFRELLQATYSEAVWSDGTLKIVPYYDQAITGNGATYTPNTTPLYDLTDDDFLRDGDVDPVTVSRKPPALRFNQVFVECEERYVAGPLRAYVPAVGEAKDQASLEAGVFRPMPKIALPMIKSASIARFLAQLLLQRELNVCNEYRFRLSWKYALLEPMDLVTLTDVGLGLSKTPVRIKEVVEHDDDGIDVVAEDWPFGTASATAYATQIGSGSAPAQGVLPGSTIAPVIFDSPGATASDPQQLCIAASGGANWGGCDVYVSSDGVQFYKAGTITKKATYGTLTAAVGSGPALPATDTATTLAVDVSPSGNALVSGVTSDVAALLTLCWVDGEFLSFATATLTSAGRYSLSTLGRGAYGSVPLPHALGKPFVRHDDAVLRLPFPQGTAGQVLWVKLPAFNVYGKALEDISTVTPYFHTIIDVKTKPKLASFAYADTETTGVFTWARNAVTHAVWVYDNIVQVGSTDPYDVLTSFPTAVLLAGSDTYTTQKPPGGFQRQLHFVARDINGGAGDVWHQRVDAAASALAGAVKVARAVGAGTADLTLTIFGSAANWPVSYALHEDTPDGPVILSGSISAVTTILPSDFPTALQARPLPLREMKRWYLVLTDVAGLVEKPHGQADRDPMPSGSATTGDYRTNPYITSSYDTDVDRIRVTVPGGKTKTYLVAGSGIQTYTVGDLLDDGTVELALLTDEARTPYVVELQGGGVWVTEFSGALHGVSSKPPVVLPRVVLSTNGGTADLYCVIQSPTQEACTLLFRDSESMGAPEYALCAGVADPTPLYVAYGAEVGPTNYFTLSAVQALKLSAIPLTRDQIVRRYVCAKGKDSGIRSSWHAIPLSVKAVPYADSIAVTWNVATSALIVTVKGGANCQSAQIDISADPSFATGVTTFLGALVDGGALVNSFALSNAQRGKVWYARVTPYNLTAQAGIPGTAQIDSTVVPPIFTSVIMPTKSSGNGTLTVTVNDPNSKLDPTLKVSFAVTLLGVRSLVVATSNTAGAGTTGDYLYGPFALDPKHAVVVEPVIHLADGTTVQPGGEAFDADLVANCFNLDIVHIASTATVTASFDTDTLTGAAGAQYSVAGSAWTNLTVDPTKRNAVFTVPMLTTAQSVRVRGLNSTGALGPITEGTIGTTNGTTAGGVASFATISVGATNYAAGTITLTWTTSAVPAGATFNVVVDEQDMNTAYYNTLASGVTSPYVYPIQGTPASGGAVAHAVRFVVQIADASNVVLYATSPKRSGSYQSTKAL